MKTCGLQRMVRWRWFQLLRWWVWCLVVADACANGSVEPVAPSMAPNELSPRCSMVWVRFPTEDEEQFGHLYNGRGFYANGNHLGRDIQLPEGAPVYAIGCGTVRVYRPATGYGTLAVVIEHHLSIPIEVYNGLRQRVRVRDFLSIYGHLRTTPDIAGGTPIGLHPGDLVNDDQLIGYVQNDRLNGDGAEHLHVGIRLQSMADAVRTDTNWFRGYDAMPSQRRWFADPAEFLRILSDLQPLDSADLASPMAGNADAGSRPRSGIDGMTVDAAVSPMSNEAGVDADSTDTMAMPSDVPSSSYGDVPHGLMSDILLVSADAGATAAVRDSETIDAADAVDATDTAVRIVSIAEDVPGSPPPVGERVVVLDGISCDGRRLSLTDRPGMTWYHLCLTSPQLGLNSTHPFSLDRPLSLDFNQFWDATLPVNLNHVDAPPGLGTWQASVAVALMNPPVSYPFFNARFHYSADRHLYAIGENRLGGPVERNGELDVWLVRGGNQSRVDTEIVGAVGCDPGAGGSLHVLGTGCPGEVCHSGPLSCTR